MTTNPLVVLRFMMENHVFEIVLPDAEANRIIVEWTADKLPKKLCGFDPNQNRHWAIDTSKIIGIFTIPPEVHSPQAQQQIPGKQQRFQGGSGFYPGR